MIELNLDSSWKAQLSEEFEKPYFKELQNFVSTEYSATEVFPPGHQVFQAYKHTPFEAVKVVIIGQDPYHGLGQSHGLCFSVNPGVRIPPSLRNIYKEIE